MEYMAPELKESEITDALQSGLLGDSVCQLTVEQLKNPTSGLILQLFMSILEKLGIETDQLGQSLPNRPMLDPELYRPRIINVTKLLNHCVPGLTVEVRDIIYPKWKQVKQHLKICVNFLRYVEYNMTKWDDISMQSDNLLKQREELLNQNNKLESALHDVNTWLKQNKDRYEEQREELEKLKTQFDKILDEQKEKDKHKISAKLELGQCTEEFEVVNKEVGRLTEEKEKLSSQVVNNPQQMLAERKMLSEKKTDIYADFQKQANLLRDKERKIERVTQTHELAKYDLQLLSESHSFVDNLQGIKDDVLKNNLEIDSMTLSKTKLHKEIENLKQQLVTGREQLHRIKLKADKQSQSHKQQLAECAKDLETLQTTIKSSEREIHLSLKELDEQQKNYCLHHNVNMVKLQEKEKMIWKLLDDIQEKTITYFDSIAAVRCFDISAYNV